MNIIQLFLSGGSTQGLGFLRFGVEKLKCVRKWDPCLEKLLRFSIQEMRKPLTSCNSSEGLGFRVNRNCVGFGSLSFHRGRLLRNWRWRLTVFYNHSVQCEHKVLNCFSPCLTK